MERKKTVLEEAEEIIENYIQKQQEISHRFYQKGKKNNYHKLKKTKKQSKRLNPKGIGLLLCLGGSVLIWGVLLWWIF